MINFSIDLLIVFYVYCDEPSKYSLLMWCPFLFLFLTVFGFQVTLWVTDCSSLCSIMENCWIISDYLDTNEVSGYTISSSSTESCWLIYFWSVSCLWLLWCSYDSSIISSPGKIEQWTLSLSDNDFKGSSSNLSEEALAWISFTVIYLVTNRSRCLTSFSSI